MITKLIVAIDVVNAKIASFFSWFVGVIVLTLAYEVVLRYAFNKPTMWSFDVTYMLCSLFVVMALPYNLKIGGHVSVDIVYNRFSPKGRAFVNVIFYGLLFFPCWLLIGKTMLNHVIKSWKWQELASIGTWMPPIYPYKTWILLGVIMLILQGVSELLKDLTTILGHGRNVE